jgi:5'-deoxynucleotidase YfbR-like HD superfamily hydrolase
VTEERYRGLVGSNILKKWNYHTEAICEPLLEHVGHLPVIAAFLHSKIEHSKEVDLGRVLTMLSVHDIGETKVGDVLTYAKKDVHASAEADATKTMLPEYLFHFYEEMERRETLDAKFAKSVDSLAPLLHEMALPDVTPKRMEFNKFTLDMIIAKKKPHFAWDVVLRDMFDELVVRYRRMESTTERT